PSVIYALSLHDALPIFLLLVVIPSAAAQTQFGTGGASAGCCTNFDDKNLHGWGACPPPQNNVGVTLASPGPSGQPGDFYLHVTEDRKSTRLNSSHLGIS